MTATLAVLSISSVVATDNREDVDPVKKLGETCSIGCPAGQNCIWTQPKTPGSESVLSDGDAFDKTDLAAGEEEKVDNTPSDENDGFTMTESGVKYKDEVVGEGEELKADSAYNSEDA